MSKIKSFIRIKDDVVYQKEYEAINVLGRFEVVDFVATSSLEFVPPECVPLYKLLFE